MVALPTSRAARDAIIRFLAFNAELVDVKRQAAGLAIVVAGEKPAGSVPGAGGPPGGGAEDGEVPDAEIAELFQRLRTAICPGGTPPAPGADGLPDIGYVMAALGDEAMLHEVGWPGRRQWLDTLLETSLYDSRVAGEDVFRHAMAILDGSVVGRSDLAAAILLALSLGFRGRWRGADDRGAIEGLRRRLFEHVFRHPPTHEVDWAAALPCAATPVLDAGRAERMPRLFPWVAGIVGSLMATLAMTQLVWTHLSGELLHVANEVASFAMGAH